MEMSRAYGGSVYFSPVINAVVASMYVDGKPKRKQFAVKKHGGIDKAFSLAEAYRRQQSDRLGQTKWLTSLANIGLAVPELIKQYIGGFFDGDGMVGIYPRPANKTGWFINVKIVQSANKVTPEIIDFFQRHYHGLITCEQSTVPTRRNKHRWMITRKQHALLFLRDIHHYAILKRPQMVLALDWLEGRNTDGNEVHTELHRLKKLDNYRNVPVNQATISDAYVAGLADAEGCVAVYTACSQLTIAQASSPALLRAIQQHFNLGGHVSETQLKYYGENTMAVLAKVAPFLVQKKRQAELAAEARTCLPLSNDTDPVRADRKRRLGEICAEVKRLKRV